MDHRFLNKEVPEFSARIPTTENLAIAIWQRLVSKLNKAQLHRVRVYETPICLSISTVKHEGASDPSLHVLGLAPPAQR